MNKLIVCAAVLVMVFTFGIVGVHAQQTVPQDHGNMMTGTGCPMMARADGAKCAMGNDGRCPMAADKCPVSSHHGPQQPGHEHGEN